MAEKFRGRIKEGTPIMQDHNFLVWPRCLYGTTGWRAPDPNMVFDMEWTGRGFKCTAPGFGKMDNYGNGAIYI